MFRAEPMDGLMDPPRLRASGTGRRWRAPLAVALALLWTLGWYWPTAASIVAIWARSPTFTHGYLILPIVLWLVWRDRGRLAAVPVAPCFAALPALAVAGFGWLLAEVAGVLGGMQFMLAAMIPLSVWAITGTAMVRALAFPLAYLFFAVPFGEFMVPTLMNWTADFAIGALRLSGIPVIREGLIFSIPTGNWSVVEECSGINYLIASVAVGTLYTYLTCRSTLRRIALIGLFAVVPLLANGIRAYLIVLIAHLSKNRYATGVDHIWLGWVLFGVVIGLMFWAISFWREDEVAADATGTPEAPVASDASDARLLAALAATMLVVCVWRPAATWIGSATAAQPVQLAAVAPANGWTSSGPSLIDWEPEFANPSARLSQTFRKANETAGVSLTFYRNQDEQRKLITSANQLVKSSNTPWRIAASGRAEVGFAGTQLSARTTEFTNGTDRIVAWHWYRVAGQFTANEMLAKAYLAFSKLSGRGDDSSLVVIYTRKKERGGAESRVLADFAADMGDAIVNTLAEAEAR